MNFIFCLNIGRLWRLSEILNLHLRWHIGAWVYVWIDEWCQFRYCWFQSRRWLISLHLLSSIWWHGYTCRVYNSGKRLGAACCKGGDTTLTFYPPSLPFGVVTRRPTLGEGSCPIFFGQKKDSHFFNILLWKRLCFFLQLFSLHYNWTKSYTSEK